jgi:ketosteroid isomerase-like protein
MPILLLFLFLLPRIGQAQAATESARAVRNIRAALDGWVEAANRQDWRAAAQVWAPDLVEWYPGQPDDTYAKEMEQAAHPKPGRPKTRYEVNVVEVMVSGPLAVVRDIWRFMTAPGTPDSSVSVVRGFEVWRRLADGHWKISRWISAPEPATKP